MIDTFGRSITYLRVSVTELCNLRCRYCMPEDGVCKKEHADMLTEDELIQAVEAAAALGITKLRITGGEPLVKKNIVSICRRASRVPGIREVSAGIFKIYASDYSTSAPFTSTVYPSGVSQFTMRVPLKPSPSSWK